MNKKKDKLMNNALLFLLGSIGSKFIQFILVPLYTYALTKEEFGNVDLVITTTNFLMPIFSLQLSDALLRFGMDKNLNKSDVYSSVFRILLIGSSISLFTIPISYTFDIFKDAILYFVIILNLRIYRDILSIMLKVEDKNKIFSFDSILYTLVLCISSIIFLTVLKMGTFGYFLSYIISNLFSLIFIFVNLKVKLNLKRKDSKLQKKIILYSLPMIINSISYWITTASDRYMINLFVNVASVGLYAVACKIPSLISTFTGIFNQAWMISSINEYENDNDVSFYNDIFKSYLCFSFVFSSLLIMLIKPFMSIYVSTDYFSSWICSSILIASVSFSGLCTFINGIFYAYKKNISATVTTIIGATINIILNFLFIPNSGIVGASIATVISWFVIMIIRLHSVQKLLPLKVDYIELFSLSFLMFLEIYLINMNFSYLFITLLLILFIERKTIYILMKNIMNKISNIRKKVV